MQCVPRRIHWGAQNLRRRVDSIAEPCPPEVAGACDVTHRGTSAALTSAWVRGQKRHGHNLGGVNLAFKFVISLAVYGFAF